MNRRTKIVATLGPATDGITATTSLLESGVDVVRLNLSHGTMEGHRTRLADVRASAAALGRPVAVVADLPGPKIRAGSFPDGGVILATGSTVRLVPGSTRSDSAVISVDYPLLLEELQPSDG